MKNFRIFVLSFCVLAAAFCFTPQSSAAGVNLLDKMSDAEKSLE